MFKKLLLCSLFFMPVCALEPDPEAEEQVEKSGFNADDEELWNKGKEVWSKNKYDKVAKACERGFDTKACKDAIDKLIEEILVEKIKLKLAMTDSAMSLVDDRLSRQ